MSHEATAWAYKLPLKGAVKPLLSALADYADEVGSCYPGQEKLALMTGLSTRTLRRAIERAEQLGLLSRERRFDAYGHRTSDRYYLNLDAESLPANLTTGQSDHRPKSTSLPANLSIPTGHSDHLSIRRTTREPSEGAQAPTPTPEPVENPEPAAPWCRRHANTQGTDRPCRACKLAAERYEATLIAGSRDGWAPTSRKPRYDPTVYCEHLQLIGRCEICAVETERAAAVLQNQFGEMA